MKKRGLVILGVCVAVLLIILALPFLIRKISEHNDEELVKQTNEIIKKLEDYREKHHTVPDSLEQLGLKIPEDFPLDYIKEDSLDYVIGFQFVAFHSKAYHSNRRRWEIN